MYGLSSKDFDQSQNPKHKDLGLSTDCISCHTTTPGWSPARFDIHNNYYVLQDAHAQIANDCKACHNGNYNNTPNTCVGCHQKTTTIPKIQIILLLNFLQIAQHVTIKNLGSIYIQS